MNREDEIRKRLESFDRQPPVADIRAVLRADLRYLLEKVERLERQAAFAEQLAVNVIGDATSGVALQFVSAEEAGKWPEGTLILCVLTANGKLDYGISRVMSSAQFTAWTMSGYEHFARLPETLPELNQEER